MTDPSPHAKRSIGWEFGIATVEARGGMLGPALFLLPDGRQVAPLQVAPWFSEPVADTLQGLMPRLRGDWACVPFGFDIDRPACGDWPATSATDAIDEGHGYGANHDWTFADSADRTALSLFIDYPQHHPIARLERRVVSDPRHPALDLELTVHPRRDCRLPIGVHPTLRLPTEPGRCEIVIDAQAEVATWPGKLAASALFAPGRFAPVSAVPLDAGGTRDVRRVPFSERSEDLVQVLQGSAVTVRNHAENYAVRLTWDADAFPSFLIWFSNRGRAFEPWNGRHLALGIEPVCAAFDLGSAIAGKANPLNARGLRTAQDFLAGTPWTTRYRIAVEALGHSDD